MNRILVVEDEKSMRDLLALMLRKEGYGVETAESAVEARRRMETERDARRGHVHPGTIGQWLRQEPEGCR